MHGESEWAVGFRSFFQEELDRVHGYAQTEESKKALRKRQVWVEPLFGG